MGAPYVTHLLVRDDSPDQPPAGRKYRRFLSTFACGQRDTPDQGATLAVRYVDCPACLGWYRLNQGR